MNKALMLLIIAISITELLIMIFIGQVDLGSLSVWIIALFDALMVSLAAIFTVKYMISKSILTIKESKGGEGVQLKIGLIVFIFEALVMLAIDLLPLSFDEVSAGLFDTAILALGASITIYWLVLKPIVFTGVQVSDKNSQFDITITSNILGFVCMMMIIMMIMISTYNKQLEATQLEIASHELQQLELVKNTISEKINYISLDVLTMADQSDLKDMLLGQDHSLYELQKDYKTQASIKKYYEQIRFINSTGMEVIRAHQSRDGVEVVTGSGLQDKSSRYYFKQGIKLDPGKVLITPLDLNIEKNVVEVPYRLMVRFVAPVRVKGSTNQGVVVLNYSGQEFVNTIKKIESTALGKLMLLDERGYFLYQGKSESENKQVTTGNVEQDFKVGHPDIWNVIEKKGERVISSEDSTYYITDIEYAADMPSETEVSTQHTRRWIILGKIEHEFIENQLKTTKQAMIFLYVAIFLMSLIGVFLVNKVMLSRREAEKKIHELAYYDSLTGLTNRRLFYEKLNLEYLHAIREKKLLAIMYIDLDYFKPINDELGHDAGDEALKQVAKRLCSAVRDSDTVARLGGDEFSIILPDAGNKESVTYVADRILHMFSEPVNLQGNQRHLGASIGISLLSEDVNSKDDLIKLADTAMYMSKEKGRNQYHFAE